MGKTIIVATDRNWLIGDRPNPAENGRTPWQGMLPADMRFFQEKTQGKRVLFSRPTYLSIPKRFRPLGG
ncbi:dihydrofolate reductase, partial [Candidatus Berkelbacteria bacterium]|nr:dihydrofolate reductase [Candidatus Berkelbacteria bacterium]